jgi:hypothetical protein
MRRMDLILGVNAFLVCVRVIMVVILWIAGCKEADVRVSSWYMLVNYMYIFFIFYFLFFSI